MVDQRSFDSKTLPIALLGYLFLAACSTQTAPEGVVARSVYGETTVADLEDYIVSLPPARRQPAEEQKIADWRRELLEEMLVGRRLVEEATEADLLSSDEGRLFVESRWEPIVVEYVRNRRIADEVEVTDDELREFYDSHPEEFGHGPQIRLRHIFKRVTRDATVEEREAARRVINDLHRQLEEGASFIELARNHSDSETAALDGLIGRLDPGALGPRVDEIVWALQEGEVSEVVETPVGFHIFRLENHLEPFRMEFAEARSRLSRRLEREETEATIEAYFEELLAASGATYDPQGLHGEGDRVLFSLDDFVMTRAEFMERLHSLPFVEQRAIPLEAHLEDLATQRLYRWEADRLDLSQHPELAAQRGLIESSALVELAYRARRREYLEGLDDSVLREYFEQNAARFNTSQLLRVRLLLRLFEEEGPEWFELYEQLDRIAKGVRAGELDLAVEAERVSDDISAERGGDTGWIRPGALGDWAGPRASKTVLGLAVGEISDPILVEKYDDVRLLYERRGYMLVRPEEIRASGKRSFEEARDAVAEHFVANGSEELHKQIGREVLEAIDAEIFRDRL